MVHALQTIHGLLQPDGRLVDIHPAGQPSPVIARLGTRTEPVGFIREEGDFVDYRTAEAALATVVERHLFCWEDQGEFIHTIVASDAASMLSHLQTNWERAILDQGLRQRISATMAVDEQDKELLISRTIRIGRLRPLAPGAGHSGT